jgi:hypothetical protein
MTAYQRPVEFRIGDVLVRSWRILSRHFLTFLVLTGLIDLARLAVKLQWDQNPRNLGRSFAMMGPEMIPGFIAEALVVFAAFQDLRGRPVNAVESIRQVASRLLPVLAAAILTALVEIAGLLLCLIPGIVVGAVLTVVIPVCVVERLGPVKSMSRSAELTHGHRWPIVGVNTAWLVISLLVNALIRRAIPGSTFPAELMTWAWGALSGSYSAVYGVTLYHDLRAVREGIGIDEIASVFD